LNTKIVQSKTTGEQTTEGGKPLRKAMSDVNLHNQFKRRMLLYFHVLIEKVACYRV